MAAAAAGYLNPAHRQRFFACPNPPSDFVQSLALQPDNTFQIDWPLLKEARSPSLNCPAVMTLLAIALLLDHAFISIVLITCQAGSKRPTSFVK